MGFKQRPIRRTEEEVEYPQEDLFELLKKGYVTYSSQEKVTPEETIYETSFTGVRETKEYYVTPKMYSVEEVAHDVFNRLLIFDQEEGTDYSVQFPETKISEILRKSLEVIKDKTGNVSEANPNQTLAAFGVISGMGDALK